MSTITTITAGASTPPRTSSSVFSKASATSWSLSSWSSPSLHIWGGPALRVGIIGGGLGGLTLGQLLWPHPNIEVTVYERSIDSIDRLCGYRIMISAHVLRKLRDSLRPEVWSRVLESVGVQPPGGQDLTYMKSNGQKLFTSDADEFKEQYSTSRWLLREALLHQTEEFVKPGKSFQRFERLPTGAIKMYFEDGTTDECDLLVGADGVASKVKTQLRPDARLTTSGEIVIFFKIPYTAYTKELLPTPSGTMAFCSRNQNIFLHSWVNQRKPYATRFDDFDIATDESFIMLGYGSPASEFHNKSKPPSRLTPEELKDEILSRVRSEPKMDPSFVALVELCVVNTSYTQIVKDSEAIKKWNTENITLIGDSVFNISTMLGKGANCAMLDAVDLASILSLPSAFYPSMRRRELRKIAQENVRRRMRERQRNALIYNLVYFGDNKLKEFCRDRGLKMAFGWIEDPKAKDFHSASK